MRSLRRLLGVTFGLALLVFARTSSAAPALLLFGGENHKSFLGCLNCGPVDSSSVCNVVGDYGSVVSDKSIWNVVSDYGSVVSDKSPWNVVADHPPVIVDKDGGFYGYFTANVAQSQRTQIRPLLAVLNTLDPDRRRKMLCG